MEVHEVDVGHGRPVSRSRQTGGLAACALAFLLLGAGVQFARGQVTSRPGLRLTPELVPSTVGEWQFVGQRAGWLERQYMVGGTLFDFDNGRGSIIGVTAAASQEHDTTFANVSTTHGMRGHDVVSHIRTAVGPGPDGRMTDVSVAFYSASPEEVPFAYAALYFDGKHFSTNVVHLKLSANLSRTIGRPQPWAVANYMRNMRPEDTPQQVSQEMAEFMTAMMPTIENLWSKYAGHSG